MSLGAFELLSPIGEGGMGAVWLGKHVDESIDVAVKVMHPEVMDDPEYREAFETEVRSVASLDHPNIVTILDFGLVPAQTAARYRELVADSPYLVMEFAGGGSVEDYFHDIRWPDVREMLLVVLDALSHAHARDVIHRDLKPENILVGCDPDWNVKLTDFGLAHAADRYKDAGKVETAWGTPQYMAPEQLRGFWREYGPWTDLYGLGCMAFELVCGDWPYNGETVWEIGQAHINEPIPDLKPRFAVPEGTQAWIRKLMAKERQHRYQHAADAAHALAQLPALDERERFGILFEAPTSSAKDGESSSQEPVAATQLMPEFEPAEPAPRTRRSAAEDTTPCRPVPGDDDSPVSDPEGPPLPLDWRRRCEVALSDELLGISLDLFGLRAIPLVDRQQERDWLWGLLHDVHDEQRARQVIVEGTAGTGKSKLIRWLCRRAREVGGARVLTAHHSPISGPADGLVPMMERFLGCARLSDEQRRTHLTKLLLQEGLASDVELAALLSMFDAGDAQDSDAQLRGRIRRQERYGIIYNYLSLLAEKRPVLVWLDDVQWGQDALGFAHYVERRQIEKPAAIFVAMTVRSEALELRDVEARRLNEVADFEAVQRRRLEPLDEEDVEQLVRHLLRLNDRLARHVLERSEGIPLFAVQLVEDWVARGKLAMGDDGFELVAGADISIPDDLHQLWDERIRGFLVSRDDEVRAHLELAATLGQEINNREWSAAIDEAELPRQSSIAEQMIDEDLARPIDDGWQFSHGMLQESLERRARENGRSARWNACCARALDELYPRGRQGVAERIASHWLRTDDPDRALEPMMRAIDEAIERGDYEHADELIDWHGQLTSGRSRGVQATTRVELARLAARRGDYGDASEAGAKAAQMADDAGQPLLAARARLWAGVGRRELGELERAKALLKQARDGVSGGDDALVAAALLELGRVEEKSGDLELARQHFDQARERYSELDDAFGEARAYNALGDVLRQSEDFDKARQASIEALNRFERLDNVCGIADCLNDLAEWHRMQGQLDEAEEFAQESRRLYSAIGSGQEYFVRLNLGMILLEKEKYAEAADEFLTLAITYERRRQRARQAEAKAGLLAANAGRRRWLGWVEAAREIEAAFEATKARTPFAGRALSMATELAEEAGKDDLADATKVLARDHSRGIRHTASMEPIPEGER